MDHNGGSVIAMVGKDCVAIASDLRLGNQAQGISSDFQKVAEASFFYFCNIDGVQGFPSDRSDICRLSWPCYGRDHSVRLNLTL
jgi:hypothetical protein